MASGPLNALGRHLALAGFMGSGKTTAGRVVAERLGRRFVDLDHEIEARAGAAIADLFAARGEAGFREVEEEVAADVLRDGEPAVVALGGGAVLSERTQKRPRGTRFHGAARRRPRDRVGACRRR